ncbi:unnamed protein product [Trichogramma brassicae]|uniref:Uncharacterized protein n=1 Tax=Trichogramma brassicae TaxID=86971 RepID=A0A6H5IGA0_9HYME|nr:unnamed protein product [Trichogramma brassicae]
METIRDFNSQFDTSEILLANTPIRSRSTRVQSTLAQVVRISRHALATFSRNYYLATRSNSEQRARCLLSRDHRVSLRILALHALARRSNWSRDQLVGPCSVREKETGDSACVDTRTLSRTHTYTHAHRCGCCVRYTLCLCPITVGLCAEEGRGM